MKSKKILNLLLLILFLSASTLFAENLKKVNGLYVNIAVMEIKSINVPESMGKSITEILIAELAKSGNFNIIERSQIKKIFEEHALQMMVLEDPSKAADTGKLLNAEKMLIGTLSKVGGSFVLSIRIIDVEKGNTEIALKESTRKEKEIVKISEKIANNLSKKMKSGLQFSADWGIASQNGKYLNDEQLINFIKKFSIARKISIKGRPEKLEDFYTIKNLKEKSSRRYYLALKFKHSEPKEIDGIIVSNMKMTLELLSFVQNKVIFSYTVDGKGGGFSKDMCIKKGIEDSIKKISKKAGL